jgi:two-component system cell cycle response regulator DivK
MDSRAVFCYNELGQGCRSVTLLSRKGRGRDMGEGGQSLKILYVEDNADNRVLVRRVLEAEGYRVLEAGDGPTGIALAQQEHPALILMDIAMPEMDGYEVTRCLKATRQFRDVPIVAVTAKVMKGDRERTFEAGCAGYIQKPIDVDLLPAQVADYLRRATLKESTSDLRSSSDSKKEAGRT